MRLRIDGHIRGRPIHIEWTEGAVSGDTELVDRARRLYVDEHRAPIDEADPVAFISALEHAAPGHLKVHVSPDTEPTVPA